MRLLLAYRFIRSKDNSSFINIISKISVLGIILGISILITVMSVMNGFEKELKNKILGFTSHVTIYTNNSINNKLSSILNKFKDNNEISGFSHYIENESLLSSQSGTVNAFFRAVDPSLEKNVGIIHSNIIFGSYDDFGKNENTIIIGSGIAKKLLVNIGDTIDLLTHFPPSNGHKQFQLSETYKIAAIYDVGLYEYNNAYAFIDLTSFSKSLKINNKHHIYADKTRVKLRNPLKARLFSDNFNNLHNDYYAQDWSFTHQSLFLAINNEKRVMFIILVLVVAIAAFNIVSSLLMLIKNKEKDIAILMALGATKKKIVSIFLLQGIFLGLIGITFGILLGVLMSHNIDLIVKFIENLFDLSLMPAEIYHLEKIPSVINSANIILITIFSIILVFISSIYPAMQASSIRPSIILRGNN